MVFVLGFVFRLVYGTITIELAVGTTLADAGIEDDVTLSLVALNEREPLTDSSDGDLPPPLVPSSDDE